MYSKYIITILNAAKFSEGRFGEALKRKDKKSIA
jgi:hypothetical protein